MKNILFNILICAVWLAVAASVTTAKPWRGIVPLKSTRADVERLLGKQNQPANSPLLYNLRNEIVVFHFQYAPCDPFGLAWNVPIGTVTSIGVIPKGKHRREEYPLERETKPDNAGAGFVYYADYFAGMTVETHNDVVTLVEYHSEAAQENLRCARAQECCVDFRRKFDEYGQLAFGDEKARLDNFVIFLGEELARGAIEVVGPSKQQREQLMKRAARARRYLVNERGFQAERVLIVDGGYWDYASIRLSVFSIGGLVGRIYFDPLPEPQKK